MLPPKQVYTGSIVNKSDRAIAVLVTYQMPNNVRFKVTVKVPAKGSAPVVEQTRQDGGAEMAGQVVELAIDRVEGGEPVPRSQLGVIRGPFNVNSPTRGYVFTIQPDFSITEQNKEDKSDL